MSQSQHFQPSPSSAAGQANTASPADKAGKPAPSARLADISFSYDGGQTWALDQLCLTVYPGEHLCILGANGSGKSTLGRILSGAVAPDRGQVELLGQVVCSSKDSGQGQRVDVHAYRQARQHIGMVFQNPEDQIVTTVVQDDVAFGPENLGAPRQAMLASVPAALEQVGLLSHSDSDPTRMSGGQQQRLTLAGSLAMGPEMLVLDEPGAMLDAAGRQDIQAILRRSTSQGTAVVHITHLLEQAQQADRVIVLDHGRIVASGSPEQVLARQDLPAISQAHRQASDWAQHSKPAADLLDESAASLAADSAQSGDHAAPILKLADLSYRFPDASRETLSQVSLEVRAGQTLAIIGRNGSGKSTLAKLICALAQPTSGSLQVAGIPLAGPDQPKAKRERRRLLKLLRQRVGYVMQYPEHQLFAETVAQDIAYGPNNLGYTPSQVQQRVDDAMDLLGIIDLADRSPFDLSGGQQRLVAIAGVVACTPQLLVLDEVTASLDPQASARIMALLQRLHQRGVTIVMNTHADREALSLADQTLLLERGKVLAYGPASSVVETYHQLLASESDPAGQLADQVPRPQTSKAAAHPAPQQTTDSQSTTSQVSVQTQNQPQNQNQTPAQNPAQDPAQTPAQASARQPAKSPAQDTTQPPSKHTSLLARLDPRAKMVTFLLAMFTAFTISTPRQLLLALVVTAGLFVAARAPLRSMFKSVKGFLVLMFLLAVLNLFVTRSGSTLASWGPLVLTTGGIWVAVLYSCRFMLIIFLGALLVETTTPTQMTDAFESLLRPLGKLGVHTNEIALVLSLALRFIPTLGQEVKAIVEAQAARGGSIESGSLSQRLHAALAVTVPVFAGALRHADNLSQALDARCYEGSGQRRTHYRLLQFKGLDFAFVSLMVIYLLALVLINFI